MPDESTTKSKTGKSNARVAPRRSGSDRRDERNVRRAEARIHDKVDRRKEKSTSVKNERRSGQNRREDSRRREPRRAGKNRRHE